MTIHSTRARGPLVLVVGLAVTIAAGCAATSSGAAVSDRPDPVQDGYGAREKRSITGSVASLTEGELEHVRASHVAELLEGRVAGLTVQRGRGGDFVLRIRGTGSLMGNNEPLVVIDGMSSMPGVGISPLRGLSPHDIERVDVLRDASATAIYGSRGANGVIVITTRRPR